MSTSEYESHDAPPASRIKVVRNAKGDPQWEVSVADGATEEALDELRRIAVVQYKALLTELG